MKKSILTVAVLATMAGHGAWAAENKVVPEKALINGVEKEAVITGTKYTFGNNGDTAVFGNGETDYGLAANSYVSPLDVNVLGKDISMRLGR